VGVVSPSRYAFARRSASGSIPIASAIRSMWHSIANWVCGAPKPRNAPLGGVLVATARAWMRTLGQR
jgi:hypothetical protein